MRYAIGLVLLAACSYEGFDVDLGDETVGNRGMVTFSYLNLDCVFGCGLDSPMIIGAEESVVMRTHATVSLTDVRAQVFPGGVAEVIGLETPTEEGDREVHLHALAAGSTVLHALNDDGSLLDFVRLDVAEIASLAVEIHPDGDGNTGYRPVGQDSVHALKRGDQGSLAAEMFDTTGRSMVGGRALTWQLVTGDDVLLLQDIYPDPGFQGSWVLYDVIGPGTARVRVHARAVQIEFAVVVE